MQLKSRRADYVHAIRFYEENEIPIFQMVTAGHFEGGDLVIVEPGAALIGYCGERSEEAGAYQVAHWLQEEGWEATVAAIPAQFIHMDALIVPIAPKLAVACVEALEDWVLDWLRSHDFEFVSVPYRECAMHLGVNLVSLGDNRILSMASSARLNDELRAMGFAVHAPDMRMFTLGGGGVHCLSQALRRDPG
jgi:N-dimethylarginine dimethylaminohydrolase